MIWYANRLIGNEEAEDVVQDIFIKLLTYPSLKEENITQLLSKMLKNKCINIIENREVRKKAEKKIPIEFIEDFVDFERSKIEFGVVGFIYSKIKELPEKCRICFELFYLEQNNINEIASKLNITISTVTSHLAIGRKILKSYFPYGI